MKLKKIKKELKVLAQIALINFLILYSFSAQSEIKEYCGENSKLFANKYNLNHPNSIYVEVINSNKWFTRLLRSIYSESGRIDKKYKKYQKARITVNYDDGIKCIFNGKIRIHGGGNDHIDSSTLSSSIRVILEDGHIGHKYNFALIIARTDTIGGRDAPEEIFASTLFRELDYLSPIHFNLKVRVNSEIDRNYIFVEIPTNEMAKDQGRNNGIFLSGNKNNFSDKKNLGLYPNSLVLNRVKTPLGVSKRNKSVLLHSLDKLNYVNLNSLGIGNGETCCNGYSNGENELLKDLYNSRAHFLDLNTYTDEESKEKNSIFNLLLNATNAHHGLSPEDRVYYYDPMFDTIEPVYNDADSNILKKEKLLFARIFKSEKKYINKLIYKLNNINLEKFKKKLEISRLNIEISDLEEIFNNIINNLELLKDEKAFSNYEPKYATNYFDTHSDKTLPFYLAFEGEENKFEVCDIKLENCKFVKLEDKIFYKLLKDKFINIDGFEDKVIYVRSTKDAYINNLKPTSRSILNFDFIKLSDNFKLYYNNLSKNIIIDRELNEIKLKQYSENDRFIFIGNNITNWKIIFDGINTNKAVSYKRDKNMIGGCISFINSEIKNLSLELSNSQCPKALEILKSNGSFSNINIINSAGDSFDSEFSDLNIDNIFVKKAKGECIGVKRGKYYFKNVNLSYCSDKSVSSGEHSFVHLTNVKINNSLSGIVAKDSSKIEVLNYQIEDSEKCLWSFRSKFNYSGSKIRLKKGKFLCNDAKIEIDDNSVIDYF